MADGYLESQYPIPVIGLAGFSDSGKTTLAEKLIVRLSLRGLRVALVKHDAHGHAKDGPGTDSSRFEAAGAAAVLLVSPDRWTYRGHPVPGWEADPADAIHRLSGRAATNKCCIARGAESPLSGNRYSTIVRRSAASFSDLLRVLLSRHIDSTPGLLAGCDLVLVEGYKREAHPKIAIVRSPSHTDILHESANVTAVAWKCDEMWAPQDIRRFLSATSDLTLFQLDEDERIAAWICSRFEIDLIR